MGVANYRRHVVLAMRLEFDVAQHDHFIVAFNFFESPREKCDRVVFVAAEPVLVSAHNPLGRVNEPFATRVFASP